MQQRRIDARRARRAAPAAPRARRAARVRSRGRALRSATRARMRSTSPMARSGSRRPSKRRASIEQRRAPGSAAQLLLIGERAIEPAAQLPRAHRRDASSRAARTASRRVLAREAAHRARDCGAWRHRGSARRRALRRASARMCGSAVFCVSRTYCSSAPAAQIASGSSSAPKPRRSSVPSWSVSSREALESSKCQGGRVR